MKAGFLPCFHRYLDKDYPVTSLYANPTFVHKAQELLKALIETENPFYLTKNYGVGKEIQVIRPHDKEGKRIIAQCAFPTGQIYRIDYGDTPFRVLFGIQNEGRRAFIFAFDTNHSTYCK